MTQLLQSVVAGLGAGSVYALLAVGFVIIYKSTLVISFAQPALMVAGAMITVYARFSLGLPFWLAMIIGALGAAAIALFFERVTLRPMVGKPVFVVAIITLGIDIVIRVIVNRFIGLNVRPVGDPWGLNIIRVGADAEGMGGIVLQQRHLAMVTVTAVLVTVLFAFFKYSRIGLAMRATAFDQETALAQGISVGTVFALSWAIAGALAAIAGTFIGSGSGIDQQTWIVALKALPAIILGGLDSIGGAVIGGLAVGVFEALMQTYQGQYMPWLGHNFSVVSPYLLMLLVLLVRPYGLFGTPEVERV